MKLLGTLKTVENGALLNLVYHYTLPVIWGEYFNLLALRRALLFYTALHKTLERKFIYLNHRS
jgi:hypothetical protein